MTTEEVILMVSVIMIVAAVLTKVCFKIGIPTLILFLSLGMIIGVDGIVGLNFSDPSLAQLIGVFALSFIIFNGGLSTNWSDAKPILSKSLLLASVGVVITAVITGLMAVYFLDFTVKEGLLLGAVVSSTDAAATFSILRSNGIRLKNNIGTLLEFESGSNDPLSYMLTIIVMSTFTVTADQSGIPVMSFIILLLKQILVGAAFGITLGTIVPKIINKINLDTESLYPMFTIALAFLIFSVVSLIGGNGLLAIYIAGLIIGNKEFIHKKPLVKFFDGQTWFMQVLLFVMLGLLVYPRELFHVAHEGVLVAVFITFVARPVAVFSILSFFKTPFRDMVFISWAGLRGAASMVFAIFPLMAGIGVAPRIFNIVFFIAVISILIQGGLLPFLAKFLKIAEPYIDTLKLENFSKYIDEMEDSLLDLSVYCNAFAVGKTLAALGMPESIRIIRIRRGNKLINVYGKTKIQADDKLLLVVRDLSSLNVVRKLFEDPHTA